MTYISIEQLFTAVKDNALTVCAVSRDCVSGFTTVSAQCAWSENDCIISAAESRSYIAIDKAELLYIEKTFCLDKVILRLYLLLFKIFSVYSTN